MKLVLLLACLLAVASAAINTASAGNLEEVVA